MVAPTVDGTDVGESWVAHQWAAGLADRVDLTLLTYRKRDRPSAVPQLPGVRVVEWVEPPGLGRFERLNSLLKPGYAPFAVRARRWIRQALADGERFDVAHQPVPVAMRYPSPLAGLGIPWVIGPVGGSLATPPGFAGQDTAPWYTNLRRLDAWRFAHDPVLRRSYEDATCVLGIAPYVDEALAGLRLRRLEHLPETALTALPQRRAGDPDAAPDDTVRLLFVGRLIRTKGARDLIAALDRLRDLPLALDIVGDGFDRAACEGLVADLGLGDRVRFTGALPRDRVEEFYARADLFVFPSFREPGGNVVFEAMGHGLPVITCDRGGPGNVVTPACGITVAATSPEQLADDLAVAVRELATDPERRRRLGAGALAQVRAVGMWDSKIEHMLGLYAELAAPRD